MLNREFLDELRLELGRRDAASESLTRKGTNMMTVSGIVLTLLLGFYASLLGLDEVWADWIHGVWISAGFLMGSVLLCVRLNSADLQRTLLLGKRLVDKYGKIRREALQKWTHAGEQTYYAAMHEEYVLCLRQAEAAIQSKSEQLTRAIRLFRIGITVMLPAIGLPVLARLLTA